MTLRSVFFAFLIACATLHAQQAAPAVSIGEGEAAKCEERIASARRDVMGKYEDALGELQLTFQKAADLEGALAIRNERQRVAKDHDITEGNLVAEPKALRTLQQTSLQKMTELTTALVNETVPRLIEHKKQLTVSGRLDEAVAVRAAIERLQNANVPVTKPEGTIAAETVILAYQGDRARADKTYKGQRISVRGVLGGSRPDPGDAKTMHVFLTGTGSSGWVQCAFSLDQFRFREEQQFGSATLVITKPNGDVLARVQKGQPLEIRGHCEGFDETVRLAKCDLPK